MAKKNVQPASEEVEVSAPVKEESTKSEKKSTSKKSKTTEKQEVNTKDSKNAKDKKVKAKNKDKKEKRSIKKKAVEVLSEFKKVSKPSFGKVVKNTCVVIAVVAICTLLLFGVDRLFSLLYNLLLP